MQGPNSSLVAGGCTYFNLSTVKNEIRITSDVRLHFSKLC